jgi:hypothetical protein
VKIPSGLLDATRSRFWRTASPTPRTVGLAAVADDADEPASPAAEPPAPNTSPLHKPPAIHCQVSPGDALLAALDACSDDAQRAALLTAASVQARDSLSATLAYREMSTLTGRNPPLGALVSALDGAADESARAMVLATTPSALLVELAEHLRTPPDIERAYMDMMVF